MAFTDAFADLPDDVIANIITCATSDIRGFAESSRRLLKAVRVWHCGCVATAAAIASQSLPVSVIRQIFRPRSRK